MTELEETGGGKFKMAATKLEIRVFQLVHNIAKNASAKPGF